MEGPEFEDEVSEFECGHEEFIAEVADSMVVAMYAIEKRMGGSTAEEKLGLLTNMISRIVYDAAQILDIKQFQIELGDGESVLVIPSKVMVPHKSKQN